MSVSLLPAPTTHGTRTTLALAALLIALAPARASANTALLLPTGGTTGRAPDSARLVARFTERIAASGWSTRAATLAQREPAAAVLTCDTSTCARAGLDALRVDAILAPAIWQRADGRRELTISAQGPSGRAIELTIQITAPIARASSAARRDPAIVGPSDPTGGTGPVEAGTAAPSAESLGAASSLADRFLDRWTELRRTSPPPGRSADRMERGAHGSAEDGAAEDGAAEDGAAEDGSAEDGAEERRYEMSGGGDGRDGAFEGRSASVTNAARTRAVAAGTTGRGGNTATRPVGVNDRPPRSPWNVAIGATILVASLAPASIGAAGLVRDGDCVARSVDGCSVSPNATIERYHAGPTSYTLVAVGALAAGTGLYLLVAGPIRVRTSAVITDESASVQLSGTF